MLTERFIVSTLLSEKQSNINPSKDVGIRCYDFQPRPALKSSLKKSSTHPNSLAVSASHIFAAQAEKAVIHVYNREKGNQEAIVPFPEKIKSIALAGDFDGAGVLVLGTEGGRVILWELCSGRQVSTPQSHLQPTTCLAVDLTSNFLLSGSPDSNIHFWSIPSLLSFLASSSSSTKDPSQPLPFSPLQTFSDHRAPINALQFGHSPSLANIAVSASADSTCIVWDYNSGVALHTFLLPAAPLCLTLDPADRAVYAGYDDGSVQLIDFYARPSLTNPLYDPALRSTPTQPPATHRWPSPGENPSPTLALQVSHDGTTILSGHQDGRIQTWDVANGRFATQLADLAFPITNLFMLPPTGFPNPTVAPLKLHTVVKPRYESSLNGTNAAAANALVPPNYTLTAQFTSTLPSSPSSSSSSSSQPSIFHQALTSPTFPPSLLEASIAAFASAPSLPPSSNDLAAQNAVLVEQLKAALHQQRSAMNELLAIDRDRYEKAEEAKAKREMKRRRRERRAEVERRRRRVFMGEEPEGDVPMEKDKESEDEGPSSSTDEITDTE